MLLENIRHMKRDVNKTDREVKRQHYAKLYNDIDKEAQPSALDVEEYNRSRAADRFRDELESLGLETKKHQSRSARLSADEYLMSKDTAAERFRDSMKNLGLTSKRHLKDKDAIRVKYCPGYTTTKTKLYTLTDLDDDKRVNISKAKVPVIRDASPPVRLSVRSRFKASDYADVDSVLLSRARAQRPYGRSASAHETSMSDYKDVDSVVLSKAKAQREYKEATKEISIAGVREYATNVLKHLPKPSYVDKADYSFLLDDISSSKATPVKPSRPGSAGGNVTIDSDPEVLLRKMKNLSYVTLSDLKSQRAPGNYGSDFTVSGGEAFPFYSEYSPGGYVAGQDISGPASGYTTAKRFAANHYSPSMAKHYSTSYDNIYEQLPPLYQFYDSEYGKKVSSYPSGIF